ncbi:DUF4038 domain-containing protein [uncultured Piscinibacter sp.]|uniref:apiosidase-like domain-containing protein n=1 Tax=uncultured Piscinibacter sp. TaxID=1131835 RepID=UPI0026273591|nr:DUF4038 domain-containing protein [uncultured Piscinibacter sp.]
MTRGPTRRQLALAALAAGAGAGLLGCQRDDGVPRRPMPPAPRDLEPVPPAPPGSLFPLQVRSGTRHLLDAQGSPFLLQGDSVWSLLAQLRREEIDFYLADRKARGYNAILVNLIESHFSDHPPRNGEGQVPFLSPRSFGTVSEYLRRVDFETPNPVYLELFDHLLEQAAQAGILVMVAPCYAGYEGGEQGWWEAMQRNGPDKLRSWGRYLGHRYRGHRNLLWVHGGDYNVPDRSLVHALADGIREYDASSLHTYHGSRGTGAHDWMGSASWLNLGNVYTGAVVADAALKYRSMYGDVPFVLLEAFYEDYPSAPRDPRLIRTQAYQALLCGACGQLSGHDDLWQFRPNWKEALGSATATSMTQLAGLFSRLPWWMLQPRTANALLRSSVGSGLDRTVAAISEDGRLALVYSPTPLPLELNTAALRGGRYRTHWMDPSNGQWQVGATESAPDSALLRIMPPNVNAAGASDWVLRIEAAD